MDVTTSVPLLNALLSASLTIFFFHRSRLRDYRKLMLVGLFAFTTIASVLSIFFAAPFAVMYPVVGLLMISLSFAEWFEDRWLKPICLSYLALGALSLVAASFLGFTIYEQLGDLRGFIALVLSLITIGMFGRTYFRTWNLKMLVFLVSVLFFMGAALMGVAGFDFLAEYARMAAYAMFAVPFILK
ncbi:MAG: hypothetical protein KAW41_06570 [Candidatus Diapherotrites archaeon]|nr:hypothetical protein [Candidatus Diapherotrites archaeon]